MVWEQISAYGLCEVNLIMFSYQEMLDWHARMLRDRKRADALNRALLAEVKKGDIVVDIGCGTGILSMMACRAGAKKVYALESAPIIDIAAGLAKENNLQDRITFFKASSFDVDLPEKADVVISETVGPFALDEGIISILNDARRRFLKSTGKIIPSTIELYLQPFECKDMHNVLIKQAAHWKSPYFGCSYSYLGKELMRSVFNVILPHSAKLLAQPKKICHISFDKGYNNVGEIDVEFLLRSGDEIGTVHGFVGYFNLQLAENIFLSNDPVLGNTHWMNAVLLVEKPRKVYSGDKIKATICLKNEYQWYLNSFSSEGDAREYIGF